MKLKYENLKGGIAKLIYRSMYKSNYGFSNSEPIVITNRTNTTNKRALAIAVQEKKKDSEARNYCIVTFEAPVSRKDSQLNMKALNIAHNESHPLTNTSTRTK